MKSYEKINYSLRPAKCIERKMLCQAMAKLTHFQNIETYRYVGFGSTYFSDFTLFHKTLGIKDLVSIEQDAENSKRFLFNRPFSCIESVFKHSNDALYELSWENPTVLWLDYDDKLERGMFDDIDSFFAQAAEGSMFIMSVNAHPEDFRTSDNKLLKERRQQMLEERVCREKLPIDIGRHTLGLGDLPKVYRQIIIDQIHETLNDRNGMLKPENKIQFKQLFNFIYQDGAQMQTIGGVIYQAKNEDLLQKANFEELEFIKGFDDFFKIDIPCLTFRELFALDTLLPEKIDKATGRFNEDETPLTFLPPRDVKKYANIYRYFPAFTESNF